MPRFFIDIASENIAWPEIVIKGDDARHIARSLRMAVGDEITVCDKKANEYRARLTKIRDEECTAEILDSFRATSELPVYVTLYMAFPKGDKLETVIQKATELGVGRIVPFESSRCIKRPKEDKIDKQLQRYRRIAEEAAKQSGRALIPEISAPMSFEEMLRDATALKKAIFCYENETEHRLGKILSSLCEGEAVSVIVGSEGGFSPEEAARATEAGCLSVTLGRRILRCETAPLFVLSAIGYQLELLN